MAKFDAAITTLAVELSYLDQLWHGERKWWTALQAADPDLAAALLAAWREVRPDFHAWAFGGRAAA